MAATASTASVEGLREERHGHIGLSVLGSIAAGMVLGLVFVLLIFGGGTETEITGSALLSFGAGLCLLVWLSRRTDQPQQWALLPAAAFAASGVSLLVIAPSDHVLALLGWVWPVLIFAFAVRMFRGSRASLNNWSRRVLIYPASVILGLVAIGGLTETVTEATASNAAPHGTTYSVNGHSLYLSCTGMGTPTVVLFNGLSERTTSWAWVQPMVSQTTRVCVFDRAGEGWSSSPSEAQDGNALADDLHGLLAKAGIAAPYVLAGHSVGGTYELVYAHRYPSEVAGLALIDSATPYQFALPSYSSFYSTFKRASALFPSLARAGIARVSLGTGFAGLPPGARKHARMFISSPRDLRGDRTEFAELPTVFKQAQQLTSLNGKPLVVLTADLAPQAGWFAAQDKLALLSSNSLHRTTTGATHGALLEDQKFAAQTSRAISDVVRAARTGAEVPSK